MNNVIQSSASEDPGPSSPVAPENGSSVTPEITVLFPSQHNTIGPNEHGRLQSPKRRRLDYLEDFLHQLDSLLFVQFSILYYYDNTFILFIIRVTIQTFFLTPRPVSISESPLQRPFVGAIVATNLCCLLSHLIRVNPQAGEITEGYLHGGIIIDFVGELGPIWKWRLVVMDLLILGLQLIMLAATLEKFSQKVSQPAVEGLMNTQDHDAEERGVIRSENGRAEEPEGAHAEAHAEASIFERSTASVGHALDASYSGEYELTNLSLLGTLRRQWGLFQNGPGSGNPMGANTRTSNDMTMLFGGLLGVRLRLRARNLAA